MRFVHCFTIRLSITKIRVFLLVIHLFSPRDAAINQQVPSAPRSVDVNQINSSSVKVSWEPPASKNIEIIGYYVYKNQLINGRMIDDNLNKVVAVVDKNKLYAYINDLEPNSEYAIRVAAFNEKGDGQHSSIQRIVTGGRPPTAPRPQDVKVINENRPIRAKIEWLPPSHTYGLPILKYVIRWKPVEFEMFEQVEVSPTQNTFILNNLNFGQEYEIHFAAVNEIGIGDVAIEKLGTPTGIPEGPPENIRYQIYKHHANFIWEPPHISKRNGNITHYEAVFKPLGRTGNAVHRNVQSQSVVFDMDPTQRYSFQIAAATSKGVGSSSKLLHIDALKGSTIGPPINVRVQALTNSSVVIQWDFGDNSSSAQSQADGFVVKYMPEPSSKKMNLEVDKWRSQTVMDGSARHLEITRLGSLKPYAFVVLAVKQNRQGPASDPPVYIDQIKPVYNVQNLRLQYKTSQSVQFQWDYVNPEPDKPIGFYVKQMGEKHYYDQNLVDKNMVSPGFERKVDGTERSMLWPSLRPYMNYTFQVGVYSLQDGRQFWPAELTVRTDPIGPPLVDPPEFIGSETTTTARIRLAPATEEQGPISHYWLIVVPSNITSHAITNVDSALLQRSTTRFRALKASETASKVTVRSVGDDDANGKNEIIQVSALSVQRSKKVTRRHTTNDDKDTANDDGADGTTGNERRSAFEPILKDVYIAAQIPSEKMQQLFIDQQVFLLGDNNIYDGYLNHPLDSNLEYALITRTFAKEDDSWRRSPFDYRPPMQEPASRLFTDSVLSKPFSTRSSVVNSLSSGWLGPAIGFFVVFIILMTLIAIVLPIRSRARRRRKSVHTSTLACGTLNKVARSSREFPAGSKFTPNGNAKLGTGGSNIPTETSKLLLGMDTDGRPVMNSYEVQQQQHDMQASTANNLIESGNEFYTDGIGPRSLETSLRQKQPQQTSVSPRAPNLYGLNPHLVQQQQQHQHPLGSTTSTIGGVSAITTKHQHQHQIPIGNLAQYIVEHKANANKLFIAEFESIDSGQKLTWEHSLRDVNRAKNRYLNVNAYDHSRVILTPDDEVQENEEGSDYINANYVSGYDEMSTAYIATQGPLPETFADFWRMVWQCDVQTIVMLTHLEERSRTKCDQYWPNKGATTYGNYRVTLLASAELAYYCIRTLRLERIVRQQFQTTPSLIPYRDIKHLQFTAWPDHGVPSHPTPFLTFLKRVRAMNAQSVAPIVVHCSAGLGRTGAFIVIDQMIEKFKPPFDNNECFDIYGYVETIRGQRQFMVQVEEQYIFIYDAVLDAAQSGSTDVPSHRLAKHVEETLLSHPNDHPQPGATNLDVECGFLLSMHPTDARYTCFTKNDEKNCDQHTICLDANRVFVDAETGAYINASWIDGYWSRNAYIATQTPLMNTINDFWEMIWTHGCSIIVMLDGAENGAGGFFEYWPKPHGHDKFVINGGRSGRTVECVSEFFMASYFLREFKFTDKEDGKSRVVRQFQFIEWPSLIDNGDLPLAATLQQRHPTDSVLERFVDFVQQVHQTKSQFGSTGPICVHDARGAGLVGVFIATASIIDRIRMERFVDIFTTCKLIRMQRPSLIEHASEYVCCYRAALQFLDTSYDPDQRQQQTPQTDTSREFAALGGDVATLFSAPISPVELVGRGGVPVQAQQRSYGSSRSPPQSQLYLG